MEIDIEKLREKVYGKYRNQANFSKTIGWNPNRINKILNQKKIPDVDECATISRALSLSEAEFIKIFMPYLSPNGDNHSNTA